MADCKLPVPKATGVVHTVGVGQGSEPVVNEEVVALKALMASVLSYDLYLYPYEGMHNG